MDCFYPKFGEVELVLVEDNNDFYDPLEMNFECDMDNEDGKLQLNDTVGDDNKFHLSVDNQMDDSVAEKCIKPNKNLKHEKHMERTPNDSINIDCEIGNESSGNDDYGQDNGSDADDEMPEEVLLNVNKQINDYVKTVQNKSKCINVSLECKPTAKVDQDVEQDVGITEVETKDSTNLTELKQEKVTPAPEVKASSSKKKSRDYKKERLPKHEKTTRHYSKRHEIPKQVVHNEAYDKKLLFCKICKIQYDKSPVFTEHMRIIHNNDKPFECYICSKPYRICSLLAEHIRYHFGEKPYKCKLCDRSFSQLQPYKAHVRKFHTLERPYKCNFIDQNNVKCEATFFDTKTYKFHLREHTNEQPFTCAFCGKKFNHSGTHQAHMRIHTNEKPYQCVIFGKSFAQISTHKAHMLTHSDEYKFPCTICEKKFKQATNLKLHMRVHTKETPYKCEDCGRGFAQLVTYRNHRRIHTGEKPFACTYTDCGKCFRHRNSFRRHLQTRTGEKPFECKICLKRLSQMSSYVSHMRKHEKQEKVDY